MSDNSKKTAAPESTAAKVKATPVKEPDPVMYVGPTLKGVAIFSTVYNRIPDAAKEAAKKAPLFLNLFIPVREYGKADEQLRAHKGYIYVAYEEAWEKLRKKEA